MLQHQFLPLASLERNEGQIEGLPTNPRQWTKAEISNLKKSIKETPELLEARGLIVYPFNNKYIILGGNMRYTALKELGVDQAPCVILPENLPLPKLKEIVIKDNGSFGEWDFDLLGNEWDDLPLTDWGVPAWETEEKKEEPEAQEDDFNENEVEIPSRVCRGDIWQLGNHRLMCGDSTSIKDVTELTQGDDIDLCLTDPPYGNGSSGKYGRGQLGVRTILGDSDISVFDKFVQINPCKNIVYFLQWRTLAESFESISKRQMKINTVAVWDKKNAGLNGAGGISEQWEAIVFAGDIQYAKFGGNVFSISREHLNRKDSPHPHQKPIKLITEIFNFITNSKTVLDGFGGSGSILITCEQTQRKCYCMEYDAHYCDVIITRWETLTGQKAIKIK